MANKKNRKVKGLQELLSGSNPHSKAVFCAQTGFTRAPKLYQRPPNAQDSNKQTITKNP